MKRNVLTKPTNLHIVVFCVLIAFSILFGFLLPKTISNYIKISNMNFKKVNATLTYYDSVWSQSIHTYSVYYEYEDENKEKYSGLWQRLIKTEEEAKAMIGNKVPIYVDADAKYSSLTGQTTCAGVVVFFIFFTLTFSLALNSGIRLILYKRKHLLWMGIYVIGMLTVGIFIIL